jgi:phosphoribosylformimino-5-aminoimidazole carboxamide ribotide isomerase
VLVHEDAHFAAMPDDSAIVPSYVTMDLIPVLDLVQGQVVHARKGERSAYAPVRSRLRAGSAPADIVEALLGLHAFRRIYVADIDAIRRRGNNVATLRALRDRFPAVEFWVDTGIADEAALGRWMALGLGRPVIGSESLADAGFPARAVASLRDLQPVLSLDFLGDAFLGPPGLLDEPAQWPGTLLAMNLRKVGSEAGPDLALISRLAAAAPHGRVYAAGGIRDLDDVARARAAGAAGALLATSLHDGRIGPRELQALCAPPT